MAPKKVSSSQASEAPEEAGVLGAALLESRMTAAGVDKVRYLAAAETNEHGVTRMRPPGPQQLRAGYYPIFLHTLFAGLVPPFSHFLMAILDTY